jgi:hypothetical protein
MSEDLKKKIIKLASINFHASYRLLNEDEKEEKQNIFDYLKTDGLIIDFPNDPNKKGQFDFCGENREAYRELYMGYSNIT